MLASFAGNPMSRVKQWPQDAYTRDGPDSSLMPMSQRA